MAKQPIDENFYDADELKEQEASEEKQRQDLVKLLDDLRWVISTPKGRRFLAWVFDYCGIWVGSYTPKDAHQTAFNEGKKDVGLRLLRVLRTANPKAYSQIDDERLADLGKKRKAE